MDEQYIFPMDEGTEVKG